MKKVGIFRYQLFKPSEIFILQQAQSLQSFHPVFIGGKASIQSDNREYPVIQLSRQNSFIEKALVAWNMLSRDPSPFLKILADQHISLMHAHFGVDGLYALEIAKKLKIPLVTTFHGFDATVRANKLLGSRKISWINYALFRNQLAHNGNLFICVSNFIRDQVIKMGFPPQLTVTHYIGIDVEKIKTSYGDKKEKIVLHTARLVEKKGTAYLIRAFAKIALTEPAAKLFIVGDGPLKGELINLTHQLGIQNQVFFLGSQNHEKVMELMRVAKIFCLPSIRASSGDSEGLPIVLLEAGATGVPIVATNHAGIPEIVENGKNGLLVTERSSEELEEKLAYLLNSDLLCQEMGRNGRQIVEENFNIFSQTAKLENLYSSLL